MCMWLQYLRVSFAGSFSKSDNILSQCVLLKPAVQGQAGKVRNERPAVPKPRPKLEIPVSKDTLKGYELSSQAGQDHEQQSHGKAEKTNFRKSNNSTRFGPENFSHPSLADLPLRGQDVIAGQAEPLLSSRPAEPPSGHMAEPEAARPDEAGNDVDSDADIAEAMVLSMQKDQRIEADHNKHRAITQKSLPEGVQVEVSPAKIALINLPEGLRQE